MHLTHRAVVFAASILVATPFLAAQSAGPSGHWEGSIQAPDQQINFALDLTRNSHGEFVGTFAQPPEKLKNLPLANFALDGKSVRFQIKGKPGERAFQGTLSDDGNSMSGDYTQSGYTIPFSLARTGEARLEAPPKIAPIGRELEGTWNGTLTGDAGTLHIVLKLSNQPDGTSAGTAYTVEEGLEIPVTNITQKGSAVTLDFTNVAASYKGDLNANGTELTGAYTQGNLVAPVTFHRAAATQASN
jgi:uncharacterized protein